MKRNLCTVLVLSMLLTSLAGCGAEEVPETPADTTSVETTVEETTETELTDELPERDFGGADYNILAAAEQWQNYYISEELTGDIINDAVYNRNTAVAERFNVGLNYQIFNGYGGGKAAVKTALQGSTMGGTMEYDLSLGSVSYVVPNIFEGLYADMNDLSNIHLSKPWWHSYINDTLSIDNKQYMASGSYGMTSLAWAIVTLYNKNVHTEHKLEDIYTLVDQGKWTFDKYTEMAQAVTTDTDGDGSVTVKDRVGLATTPGYYIMGATEGMDYHHITKNDDGRYSVNPLTERMVDISEKIYALRESDAWIAVYPGYPDDEVGMMSLFSNDQALFLTNRLNYVEYDLLRDMENYGILPHCKYDESQEEYITATVNDLFGVPVVVKDLEMSSIVLEALNSETWFHVIPAYFDTALQRKLTRDEDSGRMLEIIINHFSCDFAYMTAGILGGELYSTVGTVENYTSWLEANKTRFQTMLDEIYDSVVSAD